MKYGLYSRYGRDENVTCRATVQPVYVSVSCRVERVWRQNKTVATKEDAGSGADDGRWQSSSNLRQNERQAAVDLASAFLARHSPACHTLTAGRLTGEPSLHASKFKMAPAAAAARHQASPDLIGRSRGQLSRYIVLRISGVRTVPPQTFTPLHLQLTKV